MSGVGESLVIGCQKLAVRFQKGGYDQYMYEIRDVMSHSDTYYIYIVCIMFMILSDMGGVMITGVVIGCQTLVKTWLLDVRTRRCGDKRDVAMLMRYVTI